MRLRIESAALEDAARDFDVSEMEFLGPAFSGGARFILSKLKERAAQKRKEAER